jgi:hypothetical protein
MKSILAIGVTLCVVLVLGLSLGLGPSHVAPNDGHWEYMAVTSPGAEVVSRDHFNVLGHEGWEMISVDTSGKFWFKRRMS